MGQVVKIGLIVALMINYGNQMHAAVEITETSINKRCESQTKRTWAKIGVRAIVLLSSGKQFSFTTLASRVDDQ